MCLVLVHGSWDGPRSHGACEWSWDGKCDGIINSSAVIQSAIYWLVYSDAIGWVPTSGAMLHILPHAPCLTPECALCANVLVPGFKGPPALTISMSCHGLQRRPPPPSRLRPTS